MLGIQNTPRRLRRVRIANARRTRGWPRNRTKYDYDPIARLDGLAHDLDGTGTANDLALGFAYNPASQIITRVLTNEAYEFPFASGVRTYTPNGRNQYTQVGGEAFFWDANGNLTSDGPTGFGYDAENRLVSASGAKSATLSYDPLGRLYQVTSPAGTSGTTRFVYDGDRLIAEYNASGTLLRRYVHGAGVDEPLLWYEGAAVSAANRRYLHADHQGSIVAVSNASGAKVQVHAYDAYGVTGSNTLRFQYTGQAAIPELGLLYYKARFYIPALGRFMQTDPIGYEDHLNLYAYVGNNPLNAIDPNGLEALLVYDGRHLLALDDSGLAVFARADSGMRGLSSSVTFGPIPNGTYSILAHPTNADRPPWYRLERHDASFGDDATPEGRSELRLHGPGSTVGCIEVCEQNDAAQVSGLLSNTSTSTTTVESGGVRGMLGATESIQNYGTLHVVIGKGTLSYNSETGKVTYTEKITPIGSRIERETSWSCTMADGKCR